MKSWMRRSLIAVGVVGVLIQFVPYGRDHVNPPVTMEPAWDTPRTRELADRACFDCHSNATRWPWTSHVAPLSWLIQHDVDEGRQHLNFSEFDRRQKNAEDAAEEFAEGEMPPKQYLLAHSEARLSDAERSDLIRGLRATLGDEDEGGGGDDDGGRRRRGR